VAIKIVSIATITHFSKERHVLREKELLNELRHPNVVELFQTFKEGAYLYFVMEYAPNGSLDDFIK
jgi:serine/threonine protein kinase